jgi:uncharacterized protein YbaA (DUF1428 family)
MPYVDGFVIPVPRKNVEAYRPFDVRRMVYGGFRTIVDL